MAAGNIVVAINCVKGTCLKGIQTISATDIFEGSYALDYRNTINMFPGLFYKPNQTILRRKRHLASV
jgi:hypothetical protein